MTEYIFHFLITIQIKHQNHEIQAQFAISARCIPSLEEKLFKPKSLSFSYETRVFTKTHVMEML